MICLLKRVAISTGYRALSLNLDNMAGNPFVNFFLLGLIEIPGNIAAQKLCDRFGRRPVLIVSFFLAAIFCAISATIVFVGK